VTLLIVLLLEVIVRNEHEDKEDNTLPVLPIVGTLSCSWGFDSCNSSFVMIVYCSKRMTLNNIMIASEVAFGFALCMAIVHEKLIEAHRGTIRAT